jgi:hypothetical protein
MKHKKNVANMRIHEKKIVYSTREQLLSALVQDKKNIQFATKKLLNNKSVMLSAIKLGASLEYLSDCLRNDRDIVLEAVKQKGTQLQYASKSLRNDVTIVATALRQDKKAKEHTEIFDKEDTVLQLLKQAPDMFKRISIRHAYDRDIVREAIRLDGKNLKYAEEVWQNDLEIVMIAVKQNGSNIKYASDALRNNKQLALIALEQSCDALSRIGSELKQDKDIIAQACKHAPSIHSILSLIPRKFVAKERAFFLALELGKTKKTIFDNSCSAAAKFSNVCVLTQE